MAQSPAVKIEYVDRPDLNWAFADSVVSVSVENKVVCKIEFCVIRWTPPQSGLSGKEYPVCRLAIPVHTMVDLHKRLTHALMQLERDGVINRAEPAGETSTVN